MYYNHAALLKLNSRQSDGEKSNHVHTQTIHVWYIYLHSPYVRKDTFPADDMV